MGELLPHFKTRFSEYRLVADTGGRFEISVDGQLLYSKLETGQFPKTKDIVKLLDKHLKQTT